MVSTKIGRKFLTLAFSFTVLGGLASAVTAAEAPSAQQPTASYLNFPTPLSANTPHDVDQQLQKKLNDAKQFDEVQRLFEILSWQNFIALNWPHDAKGVPLASVDGKGNPEWINWKESFEVYLPDGGKPAPWGKQIFPPNFKQKNPEHARVLFRTSKASATSATGKADIDDEIDQAFTAPIWDQNGNMVRYEVLLNEQEFDYLVSNELYNIDGQIAFSNAKKTVVFPTASRDKVGAIELKLAWRVLDKSKDIVQRFFTQQAYVMNTNGSYSKELVGLVGMHISLKTQSSPQWIWATFEQVDNLETNPLVKVDGKKLTPSFYDPNCPICPINRSPNTSGDYSSNTKVNKNQIQRVLPISQATQQLNQQVQSLLAQKNSVIQYYQLIGTQWPTDPSAKPYPVTEHSAANPPQLPDAITNKSGGNPTPTYLTNMIMETYFQGSTAGGSDVTLYNTTIANTTAWHGIQSFQQYGNVSYLIFGTEGCMGCHYSASIATGKTMVNGKPVATYGASAAADFSWLLQLKAQFKTAKTSH